MSPTDPLPESDERIPGSPDDYLVALPAYPDSPWPYPESPAPESPFIRKPHPNVWWASLWTLGVILIQIPGALIGLVIGFILVAVAPGLFGVGRGGVADLLEAAKGPGIALALVITHLMIIGLGLLVLRLALGRDWTRQVALRRPGTSHLFLVIAAFPCVVVLGNVVYSLLRALGVPSVSDLGIPGMEQMNDILAPWPWPFAVFAIAVLPAIGEELWCRAFFGRGLVGHYGAVAGVLFSSFFFGVMHVDPAQGSMAIFMGIFLHYVYLTTRSLWMTMLLHFLNNGFAVLAPRVSFFEVLAAPPKEIPLAIYATIAVLFVGVVAALYQSRARLVAADGNGPPPWRPPYPGVAYPPRGSGTEVAHPLPNVWLLLLVAAAAAALVGAWLVEYLHPGLLQRFPSF
jgi:uncharacterized protein